MLAVSKPVAAALAKRCDSWHLKFDKMSFEQDGDAEAKTTALTSARNCYQQVASIHLKPAVERNLAWLSRLRLQLGEKRFHTVDLVSESRLVVHLGRANVLENVGIYVERTIGLPVIPGTALKGVISTWSCWVDHFNDVDGSFCDFTRDSVLRSRFTTDEAILARRILVSTNPSGSEHAGEVIFLGGFPVASPKLALDIVNPHHEADGREKTKLTPNAFLCVEPGIIWRFAFFVRPGAPDAASMIDHMTRWIVEALTQTGIGAKTAAGYGRFRLPTRR